MPTGNKQLDKILDLLRQRQVDPRFIQFVETHIGVAREKVADLKKIQGNNGFHNWKHLAISDVQHAIGYFDENWMDFLVHQAYEEIKASGWFRRFFGKLFGWLSRVGLDQFIKAQLQPFLDRLAAIPALEGNADVKRLKDDLWKEWNNKIHDAKGTWISMLIQTGFLILKSQQNK